MALAVGHGVFCGAQGGIRDAIVALRWVAGYGLCLWPGEGWGTEGPGGGELHFPLLPRLLIAAGYTVISC